MSQWKLQRLSTYGMLSLLKQSQLTKIIDVMIDHGLVVQREVDQRRPTIEISELGKSVMHLKVPVPGAFDLGKSLARSLAAAARHIESTDVAKSDDSVTGSAASNVGDLDAGGEGDLGSTATENPSSAESAVEISLDDLTSDEDNLRAELVDSLRRWRRRTAAALGIPAYRVLTNSTIDRLAETAPMTSTDLEQVAGIGPATIEQFGYDILELIRESHSVAELSDDAVQDNLSQDNEPPITETLRADPGHPPDASVKLEAPGEEVSLADQVAAEPPSGQDERDAYWTWRLFSEGFTLDEVCQIRRLPAKTVTQQLRLAEMAGRSVSPAWHI